MSSGAPGGSVSTFPRSTPSCCWPCPESSTARPPVPWRCMSASAH
ncbi:hypothetical protein [Microbacterium sp. NIBRBAC000506063]